TLRPTRLRGPLLPNPSSELLSRSSGLLRRKSSVSDRHRRSAWAAQSFNLGVELFGKCVDDAGAKPSFWLSKDDGRISNSIVGARELPIRSGYIERNGDLPNFGRVVECMLDSIDDKFGDDQSEALGIAGRRRFFIAANLQRDCPIVADHRLSQGPAKLREIRLEFDGRTGRGGMKLLLHGCNRHDPFMSISQMTARFFLFYGLRLHHNDACDNLEAIGDTVPKFLKQQVLLPQQIVLFALQEETFGDVLDAQQNIGA